MCPSTNPTVRSGIDCVYIRSQLVSYGVSMDVDVWIVGSVAKNEKPLLEVNDVDILVDADAGLVEVLPEKGYTLDIRMKEETDTSIIVPIHFLHGYPTKGKVNIKL